MAQGGDQQESWEGEGKADFRMASFQSAGVMKNILANDIPDSYPKF